MYQRSPEITLRKNIGKTGWHTWNTIITDRPNTCIERTRMGYDVACC